MKRLLYVCGGGVSSVRKDGESLVVQVEGQAERRFPFRFLSRVVLRGDTRIHAAAIWGLMDAGVPISLQGRRGEPCGFVVPYRVRQGRAQEDLESLLERSGGRSRWDDWLRSSERKVIREVCKRYGLAQGDLRVATVESILLATGGESVARRAVAWRSFLAGELLESLAAAGVTPGYLTRVEGEVGIVRGLARMLGWEWWCGEVYRREGETAKELREVWSERERGERARCDQTVAHFLRWLRGVEWEAANDMHGW